MCSVTAAGVFLPLELFLHQNPDGSPSPVGWGVRCAVDIPAGTFLSAFTGVVAVNAEIEEGCRYVMSLDHYIRAGPVIRDFPEELGTVRPQPLCCGATCDDHGLHAEQPMTPSERPVPHNVSALPKTALNALRYDSSESRMSSLPCMGSSEPCMQLKHRCPSRARTTIQQRCLYELGQTCMPAWRCSLCNENARVGEQ